MTEQTRSINVHRHADAASFLAASATLRAREPALTNVIGSVATGVVAGRQYQDELWLTAHDASGDVVGCAIRTAPWHLTMSPMAHDAAFAVGRYVADADPDVPGVNGPRDAVEAAVRGLGAEDRAAIDMVETVRVLHGYRPPRPTPGSARLATASDTELLLEWYELFCLEAGVPTHDLAGAVAAHLSRSSAWLWEVDGAPAAMAGHAPLVDTPAGAVGRIGPVFTPQALRGHGYGSAVTGAVTEALLTRCGTVMLFADAAKPENNRLYGRLGFAEVAEIVEVVLR